MLTLYVINHNEDDRKEIISQAAYSDFDLIVADLASWLARVAPPCFAVSTEKLRDKMRDASVQLTVRSKVVVFDLARTGYTIILTRRGTRLSSQANKLDHPQT